MALFWMLYIVCVSSNFQSEALEDFDVNLLQTELKVESSSFKPKPTNFAGQAAKRTLMSRVAPNFQNELNRSLALLGVARFRQPFQASVEPEPDNLSDNFAWFMCGVLMLGAVCTWVWVWSLPYTEWGKSKGADDLISVDGKERFAYLDHGKVIAIVVVFIAHGGAHLYATPNPAFYMGDSLMQVHGDKDEMDPMVGFAFMGDYIMMFFAGLSGAVSGAEANQARMAVLFFGILFPVVLLWAYHPILFGVIITDPKNAMTLWGIDSFSRMFWDPEPWYLKGLVFWRIWLYVFGAFPDALLLLFAFITDVSYESVRGDDMLADPTINYFRYLPAFILGFILVRKRKLLHGYCALVQKYWFMQPVSFLWMLFCWVIDPSTTNTLGSIQWRFLPEAKLPYCICKSVLGFTFIVTTGFWLPVRATPLTKPGSRTLTAYLINGIAIQFALKPFLRISWLLPPAYYPAWLISFCFILMPALALWCCSESVMFVFWWIFEPGWLLIMHKSPSKISFSDMCTVTAAVNLGWQRWLIMVVGLNVIWLGSGAYMLL